MKKLITLLGFIIIFGFTMDAIHADASSEQEGLYIVTPDIPSDINAFANGVVAERIALFMTGNTNENIFINDYASLHMGAGFYAFDQTTGQPITTIIYFPIFEGERYVLTLIVIKENETLTSFMSNYFDTEFQNVSPNTPDSPYALLHDGSMANYLLTESGQTLFQGIPQETAAFHSVPLSLQTLLQGNGVTDISQEQLDIDEQTITSNIPSAPMAAAPQGFSVNTSTTKRLDMSYCLLPQYDEPICWAASLGTAYRYRTGNRTVTPSSVCNMLGLPYEGIAPNIVYQKYNALNVAGTGNSYSYKNGFASPFNVQHNINNMFPFHLHATFHAMLAEGYHISGSNIELYYWDPAVGKTLVSSGYSSSASRVILMGAGSYRPWDATTLIQ